VNNRNIVDEILFGATSELLSAYGLDSELDSRPIAENSVNFGGVIGFSGDDMRGTLLIAPSRGIIERSRPVAETREQDWVGELCNQLLGRFKNRLLARGTVIHMTTPLAIRGQYIVATPRENLDPLRLRAGDDQIWIWLDLEMKPELTLAPVVCDDPIGVEGQTIIF
jgi:hypothetical protein